MNPVDTSVTVSAVFTSLVALGGWLKWGLPRIRARREREAAKDFVIYGGIVKNPMTGRRDSEQPPLGVWMTGMKDDVAEVKGEVSKLSTAMTEIVEQNKAIAENRSLIAGALRRIDVHDRDIEALKLASTERIVTKAESAQMWRAVAEANTDTVPDA